MSENWTVRAEGLSKKFGRSLQNSMRYGLLDSLTQLRGRRVAGEELRDGEFWAVKDVSFELNRGDSLGIMGVNGSGKSTLLRLLTGVYRPDVGRVSLRGTTGALIAAGAGFAPMLTGRENIFVNGALLGMSRATIEKRIDEIIAFAELEGFLDMPVKNYSSGMVVRLGFAIAAMSEPEILIVDEVLAVGDVNFQKKCYDYLFRLKRSGTTIILVSHSVGAVWAVCDRAIFMDHGEMLVSGPVEDVIRAYDDQNARAAKIAAHKVDDLSRKRLGEQPAQGDTRAIGPAETESNFGVTCRNIIVSGHDGIQRSDFLFGEDFVISATVDITKRIDKFILRYVIDAAHYRNVCTIDSYECGYPLENLEPGRYKFSIRIRNPNLRPGFYSLNVAVVSKDFGLHLFLAHKVASIVVQSPDDRLFYSDPTAIFQLDAAFHSEKEDV